MFSCVPRCLNADAPPRQKRPLRVGAPQVAFFKTSDGVTLRLTRYQGGTKGPVILSHGLGVSSLIFSMDTIETNLLEYLYAHGYDVWLLDYRNSIELPAATLQASGDDVATQGLSRRRQQSAGIDRREERADGGALLGFHHVLHGHAGRAEGCALRRGLANRHANPRAHSRPISRPASTCHRS